MDRMKSYKNKLFRKDAMNYGIVVAAFLAVQLMSATGNVNSLMKGILVPVCTYVILALSLNLCVGILGDLSLGHAGFMCVGAFTGAFFTNVMRSSFSNDLLLFICSVLLGAAAAGAFGLLIGIPVLRLSGDYLAIVTLAFGEIVKNIINSLFVGIDASGIHISMKDEASLGLQGGKTIIKGAQGITGTPKLATFTIGAVLVLITLFVVQNLIRSRAGRAIMAIRDNRIAAESIGIPVTRYKLMAFAVSAALAGMGGVLYAHNLASLAATSSRFGYNMSITILVFVVLGGIGSMRGSMIAATVLTLLPEMLRGFASYRMLIYAIVLIVMMIVTSGPRMIRWREQMMERLKKRPAVRGAAVKGAD